MSVDTYTNLILLPMGNFENSGFSEKATVGSENTVCIIQLAVSENIEKSWYSWLMPKSCVNQALSEEPVEVV